MTGFLPTGRPSAGPARRKTLATSRARGKPSPRVERTFTAGLGFTRSAHAAAYTILDLGTLGGTNRTSNGFGTVNDSGQVVIWQMNGAQIVANTSVATPGNDWHVADVGDYNADGHSDILWRNDSGQVAIWNMNGATITNNHSVGTLTPDWAILNHQYDVL